MSCSEDGLAYSKKIIEITEKVEELLSAYSILKEENSNLKMENETLKDELEKQIEVINGLQGQKSIEQIGQKIALSDNFEKSEIKQQINEFIKEIDKCVAMLNN